MEKIEFKNSLVVHPLFNERMTEIKKRVKLPTLACQIQMNNDSLSIPRDGKLIIVEKYTANDKIKLDASSGRENLKNVPVMAYDESIEAYPALEGDGVVICHSLVYQGDDDYIPSNYLTFAFYTSSKKLLNEVPSAQLVSRDIQHMGETSTEIASKLAYVKDRADFILSTCPDHVLLLIDGPLIGGQISSQTVDLNRKLFEEKSVIPVFIVKNSLSNLVTDNTPVLRGNYNSDMHWAFDTLKGGERTPFFSYKDQHNHDFSKIFCYIKPFENASPQRIEFHPSVYDGNEELISNIMDLMYYYYIDQGNGSNVQVRPVAIAELYARETKKLFNLTKIMSEAHIQPTMNKQRGMI